ncbi:predicted protein [Naegleria gruberi]|uniref:Predicted protein n=1 Tax=Naegleria gruberi TaxID=5762 RepID=D2VA11_NAEGR|nr:uncharacterized protein NAEGRDRAFT_65700 [Naegleria gruberi]EFC46226.1 predicted protein [Naegleria gruberi]|eukprot:XP_002678970.1 predicted protein [Naegleria gruberi strain NEG-M]
MTRKLFEKRKWFAIQTKIENLLILKDRINDDEVEAWKNIVNYMETKPFGKTPKEICQFKIYDRTLLQYLCMHFFGYDEQKQHLFDTLVEKYEANVLPCLQYTYFSRDFIQKNYILADIEKSKGKSVPFDILIHAFNKNFFSKENLDQLVILLKKYRQRDFRPLFMKRILPRLLGEISETYVDFAKKLNYLITKLKVYLLDNFSRDDISKCVSDMFINSNHLRYFNDDSPNIDKEIYELVKMGYGQYLNLLPIPLVSSSDDTLNLLKLVVEQGIDLKQYPYIIHETLMSKSYKKIPTLKYLIEERNIKYIRPPKHENDILNRFICPSEEYLENIEYLSSKLGLRLTCIDSFVHSLNSDVRFATLQKIVDHVTEKFKIDVVSNCLSRVYYSWQNIAAREDANLETQKKVLRYLEAKFPNAII